MLEKSINMTDRELRALATVMESIKVLKEFNNNAMASKSSSGFPIALNDSFYNDLSFALSEYKEMNKNTQKLKKSVEVLADVKFLDIDEQINIFLIAIENLEEFKKECFREYAKAQKKD